MYEAQPKADQLPPVNLEAAEVGIRELTLENGDQRNTLAEAAATVDNNKSPERRCCKEQAIADRKAAKATEDQLDAAAWKQAPQNNK